MAASSGEHISREPAECLLSPIEHAAGSLVPVPCGSDLEPPPGGEHHCRTPHGERDSGAGAARARAPGPAGVDRDAHNTTHAADAGADPVLGGGDARGGAAPARLSLPRLEDVPGAPDVDRVSRGDTRSRCRGLRPAADAARAGCRLAAATPGRRTKRDRSRPGCATVTSPAPGVGWVTVEAAGGVSRSPEASSGSEDAFCRRSRRNGATGCARTRRARRDRGESRGICPAVHAVNC